MCGPVSVILAVFAVGCRPADEIRTERIPKSPPPRAASQTRPTGEPTDRMLAVIVPEKERAWFYKVVGPIDSVDEHAEAVLEFVTGASPADGAPLPNWSLPEGWTQQPGTGGMFAPLATILIPTGEENDDKLELTINSTGWDGSSGLLLANVNRWRGQMGLPQIGAGQLAESTRQLDAAGNTLTVVDLRGIFSSGGMGPFAGGGRGGLPADHPPIDAGAPHGAPAAAAAQVEPPKFDAPASWESRPAGGMNRAAFRIEGDGQQAEVTVSIVSASVGPSFTSPLSIANMWRRGVGMPELTADQVGEVSEEIEIGGHSGTYVTTIPEAAEADASPPPSATLGAIVPIGDQVWFFKMKGHRDLVTDRQEEFKTFLNSVQFDQ